MSPFPTTSLAGLPAAGSCCIRRVDKKFSGSRDVTFEPPYDCAGDPTRRGTLTGKVTLSTSGSPCDPQPSPIADGSTIEFTGTVIHDVKIGLADFVGRFTLRGPKGAILGRGVIELMDHVCSHPNGRPCNAQNHVEGFLVGLAGDGKIRLSAFLVASGELGDKGGTLNDGRMIGVIAVIA